MNENEIKSLEKVIDYSFEDEVHDWHAQGKPKEGHIFHDLYALAGVLKRTKDQNNKFDEVLKKVVYLIGIRWTNMEEQDKLDGKTNATESDYLLWALEEVCANDGVIISLQK